MAGNANSGRREQHVLTAILMELKSAGKDMPELRRIARVLIDKALEGDPVFTKELFDRLDGKPRQAMELSDPDGNNVFEKVVVVFQKPEVDK